MVKCDPDYLYEKLMKKARASATQSSLENADSCPDATEFMKIHIRQVALAVSEHNLQEPMLSTWTNQLGQYLGNGKFDELLASQKIIVTRSLDRLTHSINPLFVEWAHGIMIMNGMNMGDVVEQLMRNRDVELPQT